MMIIARSRTTPLFFILILLSIFLQCIQRDNLWDPANGCHPVYERPEIERSYKNQIRNLLYLVTDTMEEQTKNAIVIFSDISHDNEIAISSNKNKMDSCAFIKEFNRTVEEANTTREDCSDKQLKRYLTQFYAVTLNPLPGIVDQLTLRTAQQKIQKNKAQELIVDANSACAQQVVLSDRYIDSTITIIDSVITATAFLSDSFSSINEHWKIINEDIARRNEVNRAIDQETERYNKDIEYCKQQRIYDPVKIGDSLKNIAPGDSLIIGIPEIALEEIYFYKRSTPQDSPIVIAGDSKTLTAVTGANRIHISGTSNIIFSNLIFSGIKDSVGARVTENSFNIRFINCRFTNNKRYGLYADDSDSLTLQNCLIMDNGSDSASPYGGIRLVDMEKTNGTNTLIAQNSGFGIDLLSSQITLRNCTISDNTRHGIQCAGPNGRNLVYFYNSLICYNARYGIWRNEEPATFDVLFLSSFNNRFFMNGEGEVGGALNVIENNKPFIIANPDFIDRENDDYHYGSEGTLIGRDIGFQY